MEIISAGDFRKGVTIDIDGNVFTIVDFQHVKPGKGAAFVRTRIKNVVTGAVLDRTWNPVDRVEKATIETKKMQYLYSDGELYYFMDNDTYEQLPLNKSQVEDALMYIRENDTATIKFYKGQAFSVEPDNFVELLVTECEPGVKAIRPPTSPSRPRSRRAPSSTCPCSSIRARSSVSTPAAANTWSA